MSLSGYFCGSNFGEMHMAVKLKKIAPLSAASLLAFGCLAGASEEMKTRDAKPMSMTGVINPPVRPFIRGGADLVLTGDALFWKSAVDGLEYAGVGTGLALSFPELDGEYRGYVNPIAEAISDCCTSSCGPNGQDFPTPLFLTDEEVRNPSPRWDWGFRIGLGVNTAWDNWDLGIVYTHFSNEGKDSVCTTNCACEFIIPVYTTPLTQLLFAGVVSAAAEWKLELNMIDVEVGRDFYVSRYLSTRPFFGIRGARIKQGEDIFYQGGIPTILNYLFSEYVSESGLLPRSAELDLGVTTQTFDLDSRFTGVGPRIGFNTTWRVGGGFSLMADLALNLLYGNFNSSVDTQTPYFLQLERVVNSAEVVVRDACASICSEKSDSWHSGKGITDLGIILEWARNFQDDRLRLALRIGYENHLFFNQNQFILPFGGIFNEAAFLKNRGDLCTQGWIFGAQLDF